MKRVRALAFAATASGMAALLTAPLALANGAKQERFVINASDQPTHRNNNTAVVASVMLEALALSLLGGIVGASLAYLYCNGASLSTLNFNTFSQVAFDFRVSGDLIAEGLLWALAIGLLGGLLPAVRAARMPVIEALRTA